MVSTRLPATLLASCLAALVFSTSAQASGNMAVGWGNNYYGQVGNGTKSTNSCQCIGTPTAVSGLVDATQISGGDYHGVALRANGTVVAWGINSMGPLGNGTTTASTTPGPVSGLSNVVAVAGGYEHNLALLSNGTVMAWGYNANGQLGNGNSTGPEICGAEPCSKTPIPVPGLSEVIAIAAGQYFDLALLSNGTVMAWGDNSKGQVGDGVGSESGCACADRPVPVPGISGAMAISAGSQHGTALLADGTIKGWGHNAVGSLGNGTPSETTGCQCLGLVAVTGLAGARAIAVGDHHGFALFSNGTAMAWGYNKKGQLGTGNATTTGCECVPAPIDVSGLSGVEGLEAGGQHSLALLSDGTAMAWGYNNHGQLGDGTDTERATPAPVNGLSGASEISAEDQNSHALIGPSQALTVALAGAGSGVVGGPEGILCPPNCTDRYTKGQVEILRAEPGAGSGFAGFSGPCTGTGACQVTMAADQAITATFGPPKGTVITKTRIKRKRGKKTRRATFSFTAPGAITGYQCALSRPKPRKSQRGTPKRLMRGTHKKPKPKFSSCLAPKSYRHLIAGRFVFRVRAVDILGVDANPAVKRFTIRP